MTDVVVSETFSFFDATDLIPTSFDSARLTEEEFLWFPGIERFYQPPFEAEVLTVHSGVELLAEPPMRGDKMADWYMTQGDTAPRIRARLTQNSVPVNLSGADVVFRMWKNGAVVVEEDATVESASDGLVFYQWEDGDTDSVGTHEASFIVTYSGGLVQTFPGKGHMIVEIQPEVS